MTREDNLHLQGGTMHTIKILRHGIIPNCKCSHAYECKHPMMDVDGCCRILPDHRRRREGQEGLLCFGVES